MKQYFREFSCIDALNDYISNCNDSIVSWQAVKLCTGATVIMVQFSKTTTTVLNESNNSKTNYYYEMPAEVSTYFNNISKEV